MANDKKAKTLIEDQLYAIDIRSLSKSFLRHTIRKSSYTTLKTFLLNVLRGKVGNSHNRRIDVIKDLTLRIPKGSSVGVIGKNGSGKSTLLKLISGIYKPDKGTISVNGRIAALIELGAGFHPDFTGRENLYLGGIMYGLSQREIDERFKDIVSFAELEEVIDDPVKTYSSGMYMRLGFSLAIHTEPDILLVDEVLAVGDAEFVNKCKGELSRLRKAGKTLVLVTHDLAAVERWCDEALWLHAGVVQERGRPRRVIDEYLQFIEHKEEDALEIDREKRGKGSQSEEDKDLLAFERWGSREVEILGVRVLGAQGNQKLVFHPSDSMQIEIEYCVHEDVSDVVFGVGINRDDGLVVHGTNTDIEKITLPPLGKKGIVAYKIDRLSLLDGTYTVDVATHRSDGYPYDYHHNAVKLAVRGFEKFAGVYVPEHKWQFYPDKISLQNDGRVLGEKANVR